ncbi:MAG: O-methyltransferase family 3 [Bacteroidetes bacterium]|jgi:predicted O-methyltransferase YrrM|nr:O-methyltransferase family 3 [Bacteroidota bacterium]
MNQEIFEKVDHYISNLLAPEDEALINTTALIEKEKLPNQSISPVQGKMLQVFAKACNAKRILELGTFGAYSTIWLAKALPENGKLITIEFDEIHAKLAKQNIYTANLSHIIEIKTGKASDILNNMIQNREEHFDLIFIDADKPPYAEYFQQVLKLSRKGSIIIFDNVIRAGKVLDENSNDEKVKGVQRLNNLLKDCKEVTATILQTVGMKEHDGMLIAVVN